VKTLHKLNFFKAIRSSAKRTYLIRQFIELAKSQTGQLYLTQYSVQINRAGIDDLFSKQQLLKTYR
jgi:hypothetical protein